MTKVYNDEQKQLKKIYRALDRMIGVCKDKIIDASTTIDDVLYGEIGEGSKED